MSSPTTSSNDHRHDKEFGAKLKQIYSRLRTEHGDAEEPILVQENGLKVLGVRTALQDHYSPRDLRGQIEDMLHVPRGSSRIIQVVGDSGSEFSPEGIAYIRSLITDTDEEAGYNGKSLILEYGYTAGVHDVNWIVNDMVALAPELRDRTIGNLVYMSSTAVEEWHCEATGFVRHFVLAYNEGETKFGEDVWTSDSIMSGDDGDVLICAEGGPQAFYQAASVCAREVPVVLIWGVPGIVRGTTAGGAQSRKFSASYILHVFAEEYEKCEEKHLGEDEMLRGMQKSLEAYLDSLTSDGVGLNASQEKVVRDGFDMIADSPRVVQHITYNQLLTATITNM